MARRTKAQIELEERVHRIESDALQNNPVSIMDLGKIHAAGQKVADNGGTDAEIRIAFDNIIAECVKKGYNAK